MAIPAIYAPLAGADASADPSARRVEPRTLAAGKALCTPVTSNASNISFVRVPCDSVGIHDVRDLARISKRPWRLRCEIAINIRPSLVIGPEGIAARRIPGSSQCRCWAVARAEAVGSPPCSGAGSLPRRPRRRLHTHAAAQGPPGDQTSRASCRLCADQYCRAEYDR